MSGMCLCCLTTSDKVDLVLSKFGKIVSIAQAEPSPFPQLVSGRILPVSNVLVAPISGKACVYYEAMAEQLKNRSDENGLYSEQSDDPNKVWEVIYGETKSSDFTLMDPDFPDDSLYVPGTQAPVKVHATEDTKQISKTEKPKIVRRKSNELAPYTKEFLQRRKPPLDREIQKNLSELRFREASFEFGEQVAALGIVERITFEDGYTTKVLLPVGHNHLTDEFLRTTELSEWEQKSWLDLTQTPSIIITDIQKLLQGLHIKPLSTSKSFVKPIQITIPQTPMKIDR